MTRPHRHEFPTLTRRAAIREIGRLGLAVVIFSACSNDRDRSSPSSTGGPIATEPTPTTSRTATVPPTTRWGAITMPNTTAYVVYRDGEATLVDTGLPGSTADFERVFAELGIRWPNVASIVITHHHLDHAGGVGDLLALAPDATVHVGTPDAASIAALPFGELHLLDDGDRVADLDVIATPGHTAGHVSLLHTQAGLLVAGDALNNVDGLQSASADTRFTADGDEADRSVGKLAGFDYDVLLMGHGEPVTAGASDAVAELAERLVSDQGRSTSSSARADCPVRHACGASVQDTWSVIRRRPCHSSLFSS